MTKILIVGNSQNFHVGSHFLRACHENQIEASIVDTRGADSRSYLLQKVSWHFLDRRPGSILNFSKSIENLLSKGKVDFLLATGLAPILASDLRAIQNSGCKTINYLTDDPFNPSHYSRWFLDALKQYSFVFSARRANIDDLKNLGCKQVYYLPFAFDPSSHRVMPGANDIEKTVDVLFAGGADSDRVPYIRALVAGGFKVALYGGYWNQFSDLKRFWHGHADLDTLCRVTPAAKMVLCLVRKANRDGQSMRSFEVPAMGGCPLMEDTPEHRELFGQDKQSALYFNNIKEMVCAAEWLVKHPSERDRIAANAHRTIINGNHTYSNRLREMLEVVTANSI